MIALNDQRSTTEQLISLLDLAREAHPSHMAASMWLSAVLQRAPEPVMDHGGLYGLKALANRQGLYDAADYIQRRLDDAQ